MFFFLFYSLGYLLIVSRIFYVKRHQNINQSTTTVLKHSTLDIFVLSEPPVMNLEQEETTLITSIEGQHTSPYFHC